MPSWLTIVCALLAIHFFALEVLAERAKRRGDITLYRAPVGLRVLLGAAIVAMIYGAGTVAVSQSARQDWWVSVLLLSVAIFCASQWPANLCVSKSGIYEQKWFGLRKKSFRWLDVASAAPSPSDDSVSVVSKSGAMIKHTKYHIDRAGFIAQIKARCLWLEPGRAL